APSPYGVAAPFFRDVRRVFRGGVGIRRSDDLRARRSGEMLQREFSDVRNVDIESIPSPPHVAKTRLRREALQVLFVWDLPRRAEADGRVGRDGLLEGGDDGSMIGPHTRPPAQGKTAALA